MQKESKTLFHLSIIPLIGSVFFVLSSIVMPFAPMELLNYESLSTNSYSFPEHVLLYTLSYLMIFLYPCLGISIISIGNFVIKTFKKQFIDKYQELACWFSFSFIMTGSVFLIIWLTRI